MKIVDLSRELYHRTPSLSATSDHPLWKTHDEVFADSGNIQAMFFSMPDHGGTHMDAPRFGRQRIPAGELHRSRHLHRSAPRRRPSSGPPARSRREEQEYRCRRAAPGACPPAITSARSRTRNIQPTIPASTSPELEWLAKQHRALQACRCGRAPGGKVNGLVHKACLELRHRPHREPVQPRSAARQGPRLIGLPMKWRGGTGSPIRAVAVSRPVGLLA